MVEVASCLRIFSGSRQYSRYLKHTHGEDNGLIYCWPRTIKMIIQNYYHRPPAWYQRYWPVQQPGLFGAGQSIHEFVSLWSDGGILVHGPSKVPLLLSSCCNGTAVHCGLQVGTYSGTIDKGDKQLWQQRQGKESGSSSGKWLIRKTTVAFNKSGKNWQ